MAIAKLSSRGPVFSYTTSNDALSAGTQKVVIMVKAGASNTLRLLYWSISFDGTSASAEPVDVQLCRLTSDGSATSGVGVKLDPSSGSATATPYKTFTSTMPTVATPVDAFWEGMVHPQGGRLEVSYAADLFQAPQLAVSSRLGIRCTAAAAVNCTATMVWEEF